MLLGVPILQEVLGLALQEIPTQTRFGAKMEGTQGTVATQSTGSSIIER
jgi:hypothetical protein